MNVLIAPDSFKGSLTSIRAAEIIADSILRLDPAARCILCPQADGGDGTLDVLLRSLGGALQEVSVSDPCGRPITVPWLRLPDGRAVIESAACIGWRLLTEEERRPERLSSFGLGELLCHVVASGVSEVLVGLGGSATNDAGVGFAEGLGANISFTNDRGHNMLSAMQSIRGIVYDHAFPTVPVTALVDVQNPLFGDRGATAVFGPQKGIPSQAIKEFDNAVEHAARIAVRDVRVIDFDAFGMGAAGGLGFALACFCGATLTSGAEFVRSATGFADALREADIVITGEGRFDAQSVQGKTVGEIMKLARTSGIPVAVFAGQVEGQPDDDTSTTEHSTAIPILPDGMPVSDGMAQAEELLARAVRNAWPDISSAL